MILTAPLMALAGAVAFLLGTGRWLRGYNPLPDCYVRLLPAVVFGLVASWLSSVPEYGLAVTVSYAIGAMYPWSMYTRQVVTGESRPDSVAEVFEWVVDSLDIHFGTPVPEYYRIKGFLTLTMLGVMLALFMAAPFAVLKTPQALFLLPVGLLLGPITYLAHLVSRVVPVDVELVAGSVFTAALWGFLWVTMTL